MTEGISLIRAWLLWDQKNDVVSTSGIDRQPGDWYSEALYLWHFGGQRQNALAEVEERDSLGESVMVMSEEITNNFL